MIASNACNSALRSYGTLFDHAGKKAQVAEIERAMAAPGFWDNQDKAQSTVGQLKSLNALVKPLDEASTALEDLQTMVEMGEEDELISKVDRVFETVTKSADRQ